ncbi:hypothetical protein BC629DRAFT_1591090 [Irpex lacteus]|nr:hypothetical protein BC629DRAFT_1591090 [Irpex lacteus]
MYIGLRTNVPEHSNIFTYLPYLFSNTHPLLTDLTMVDCRLILTTANYRGLTKLNIRFTRPMMSLRQDEDFICILRGSPRLAELRLENMNLYRESHEPMEVVPLPRLRFMYLRLTVYDLKCVLSAISAPPTLRLSIAPSSRSGYRTSPSILALIISPGQQSLTLLTESVYLDVDPTKHGIFTYRDTAALQPALSYRASNHAASTPAEPELTSADLNVLVDIHTMPALERVRFRDIDPAPIVKLLSKSPSITDIELLYSHQGIGNTEIMPAIMHELRQHSNAFLPKLRSLRLQEVYISVETLFDLVEFRRACPEFGSIYLHACQGDLTTEELVETLKTEFEVVEWTSRLHMIDRNYRHRASLAGPGSASGGRS